MDQSKSSSSIPMPRRQLTIEFAVGLFSLLGLACVGALSIGLGGFDMWSSRYAIIVEFDNISGLQKGASVEIGGVPIGEVSSISLKDPTALVTLLIEKDFAINREDIASIRTKGIIGDRYIKISRGMSADKLGPGEKMAEMGESVVDIEDLIGKLVHNMSSKD